MKFVEIKYKKFSFPLNPPIQNSSATIKEKDFLILKAKDSIGNFHYGEVSPLPGFSIETIKECEQHLIELISLNILADSIENLKQNLISLEKHPSLLFGLEQLILSSEQNEVRTNQVENKSIKLNGLVGIKDAKATINEIKLLRKLDFDTIKIKIGREDFNDDLKVLDAVNNEFGDTIRLRLDNNGSWKFDQAIRNIEKLNNFNVEYIEQPVIRTEELINLAESSQINIAADESLTSYREVEKILESGNIKYFVLKPSIRIGIYDTLKIIELAKKSNSKIIISSAFETIIGRLTLLYLASLTSHTLAHGLSTQLLGESIFSTEINFNSSIVDYTEIFSALNLIEDIL